MHQVITVAFILSLLSAVSAYKNVMPFTSITNRKSTAKNAANNENVQALDDLRSAIIEAAARGEKYHGPVTAAAEKVQPNALQQQQIRASIIEAALKGTDKKPDLEADPYWDMSKIPSHTFKAKEPHVGKIVSVKRIVGPTAIGEICEIVIGHGGKMPYWEGQSYGIIPPGINEKNGKPHNPRLYSIASTRYGDDGTGTTTTFTVRRAAYFCPELKAEDPAKKGVCSNFLCDSKPGTPVTLIGPSGKVMLIPEKDPNADIIMVATGTGIAPFRSFIRRLFVEDTPAARNFKGVAWLFLGVAGTPNLLYDADWQAIKQKSPEHFRVDYALSREVENKKGGKMYIQDKVEEYSDEIFERMDKGAHMYFCGLKGMMPGILEMFAAVCAKKGISWDDKFKYWKEQGQWHVEVY